MADSAGDTSRKAQPKEDGGAGETVITVVPAYEIDASSELASDQSAALVPATGSGVGAETVASDLDESSEAASESTGLVSSIADGKEFKPFPVLCEKLRPVKEKWTGLPAVAQVAVPVSGLLIVVLIVVLLATSGSGPPLRDALEEQLRDALEEQLGSGCSIEQDGFSFNCTKSLQALADTVDIADPSIRPNIPDTNVSIAVDLRPMCSGPRFCRGSHTCGPPTKLSFAVRELPLGEVLTLDVVAFSNRISPGVNDIIRGVSGHFSYSLRVYAWGRIQRTGPPAGHTADEGDAHSNPDILRVELALIFCVGVYTDRFDEGKGCSPKVHLLDIVYNFRRACDALPEPQHPTECGLNATAVDGQSSCLCDDGFIDEPIGYRRDEYGCFQCPTNMTRCRSCGDHASTVDGECVCDPGFINDPSLARAQQFAWDTWDALDAGRLSHFKGLHRDINADRTYGFVKKSVTGSSFYSDDMLYVNAWSETGYASLRTAKLACRSCGDHGDYTPGAGGAAATCVCHDTGSAKDNYEGAFCEFPPALQVSGAVDSDGDDLEISGFTINGAYDRHESTRCNGKPVYEHSGTFGTSDDGVVIYQPEHYRGHDTMWVIGNGKDAEEGDSTLRCNIDLDSGLDARHARENNFVLCSSTSPATGPDQRDAWRITQRCEWDGGRHCSIDDTDRILLTEEMSFLDTCKATYNAMDNVPSILVAVADESAEGLGF
eukprot:COSAG02_NODE_6306_length_3665_cov_51.234997_2_plen_717_part_00